MGVNYWRYASHVFRLQKLLPLRIVQYLLDYQRVDIDHIYLQQG